STFSPACSSCSPCVALGVPLVVLVAAVLLLLLLVVLLLRRRRLVVAARALEGPDRGRRAGDGARAVALVGGLAGLALRQLEEAAAFAGVVDLHRVGVAVAADQRVAGEEEGVDAVGADRDQAGVGGAAPRGDQAELAVLPLVDVGRAARVPERQR